MFPLVENFSELYTTSQVLLYLALSVGNAILLFFCSMKFLLVLQQSGYQGKRYFKWLDNKNTPYLSRLMLLCLLGFLFFCVMNTCFSSVLATFLDATTSKTVACYLGFGSYLLFTISYINTESSVNAKVPLKKTKRLVRLAITYLLVLTVVSFGFITLLNYLAFLIKDEMFAILRFSVICLMPIIIPYLLFLAYIINEPFETLIRKHHLKNALLKLERTEVIKIGITGSYGKTSVKEILKVILSQKYRVLASPESFNTPLGIALAVKKLDSTHDIFIAEMGARVKGDIDRLAKMVKPTYAVLTGITSQHLESFGSLETLKDTKYELFENLNEKGKAFFNVDGEDAVELYNKFNGDKYSTGVKGDNFVTAKEIETTVKGTKFMLCIRGEEPILCQTSLLGMHSISNICLAVSVAYKLGLTKEEIAQGINRIKSVGHRLELIPNNKNIVIIDDSYNANETGVVAAMETLNLFNGRKIVLTPGLVELGKRENIANFNFGKLLATNANIVIIIGKHNAEMLINGLVEGGMAKENIIFAKNLKKGNEELNKIIKEGDVVLFENDLPDNYN
ncbi:MAG: UDP-N-acetylmuramoyl-tripeptide--D-alanyl-D-alanine ligase [Clostridia bacterium]|nr:UDP-N-acetylmuramoyl-tripeptide--D-alanyl-D-alanine ligase [Clostridia bacterium]